ncbi:MAG: T9SS type A sorting domain-containing protein [Bacteroidales bacterium]|nr:T9SS type A sorting domain-containing protein [Bacteroidales bacterium]
MKKILLFLSGALLSLGLSATEYEVTVDTYDFVIGGENNVEITDQLGGALLKEGDWILVTVKAYFDQDIRGVNFTAVADNSAAAKYWKNLTAWSVEKVGGTTSALTLFEGYYEFEITADAESAEKIVIRMDPLSDASMVKMRPTASFVAGATYTVAMPTVKFGADDPAAPSNYKADALFTTDAALAADDIIKVTIDGTFSQDVDGINFMVFDKEGNTVLAWTARPFSATAGTLVSGTEFEFTVPKASEGTEYKLSVFFADYDAEKEIKFLKDGDVEHEAVKLATKEYTNVTLAANVWDSGSNYQAVESVASDVFAGDYVEFSVKGIADQAIAGLQAYLMDDSYNAISAYLPIKSDVAKGDEIDFSGVLEVSSASASCKLVIVTTDAVVEGVDAINIKVAGTTPEPTAVEEVSASLAVQGGMVYSAGEIVVYNVAGKVVATASQALNVNSLNAGVYFIVAQEGTIKYVK